MRNISIFKLALVSALVMGVLAAAMRNNFHLQAQDTPSQTYTVQAGAAGPANVELLAFAPQTLQVHRGDTVTWFNNGFHNIRFGSEPLPLVIAPEMDGQPLPQVNPGVAFPTIESGAVYQGGDANSGLPGENVPPIFSLVIDLEPGTYSYLCDVHPGMVGVITVVPDDQVIPSPLETSLQAAGEIGGSIGAALEAANTLETASMMIEPGQVQAGSGDTGRVTINQFSPFSTTVKVGQTVTWTNPEGSNDPHLVGWPPVRNQDVVPLMVEGGPPILSMGPSLIPTVENGGMVKLGDAFNSGFILPGQTFSLTFTEPGVYPYTCNIHPAMNGVIVVEE